MSKTASDRLRALIEESLVRSRFPWWEWDISSNRVTASPQKVTMLGYRPEDFADAGYERFMALVHPDDYDRTMQAMCDHLEGRAPLYEIDYRIRNASGVYRWYMDRGVITRRDTEGRPLVLRGIVLDLGSDLHARAADAAIVKAIRKAIPRGETSVLQLCSGCLRMRYGDRDWISVPATLRDGFPEQVSHGLCTDCMKTLYPKFADGIIESLE